MPPQPVWLRRLPAIVSELRAIEADYLDRRAVERIFGVRQRRARQLMADLPTLQVGNAVAIPRRALLDRLETTAGLKRPRITRASSANSGTGPSTAESLETLRQHAASGDIHLFFPRTSQNLSPGTDLRPGELRIRFDSPEDLAAKLVVFSQALASDWDAIAAEDAPQSPSTASRQEAPTQEQELSRSNHPKRWERWTK